MQPPFDSAWAPLVATPVPRGTVLSILWWSPGPEPGRPFVRPVYWTDLTTSDLGVYVNFRPFRAFDEHYSLSPIYCATGTENLQEGDKAMGTLTQSKRQLAWVFDLNKCIGCQTCSVACKVLWPGEDRGTDSMWWMTVNTQPGRGMPRDWETMGGGYVDGHLKLGRRPTADEIGGGWDFNYDQVLKGGRGRDAHLHAISGNSSWGMNWDEDEGGGQYPNSYLFYLPRLCAHCTRPACVEACPHDAVFKRDDDGIVLIDEERCRGDGSCIEACPYKKIDFNALRGVSQKCIGCFPRIDHGVAPACVRQCPGRAAFVGFLDDEGTAVHKLVRQWNVAIPLHPEFGVESNVYYVPPLAPTPLNPDGSLDEEGSRIPPEYLESLFGPAVHTALATLKAELEKRRRGDPSELLDTLILYHWKDALGHLHRDPADIDWTSEPTKGVRP